MYVDVLNRVTDKDVYKYVGSLKHWFNMFNRNPLLMRQYVQMTGTNTLSKTKVLYYWLFVNQRKLGSKNKREEVLRQIHDMWALSLFVELHLKEEYILATWKYKHSILRKKLTTIFFRESNNKYDPTIHDSFYEGDVIYNSATMIGIVGNKEQLSFPTPNGSSVQMDARRMSQLIPFSMLSQSCRDQDIPFYNNLWN